MENESRGSRGAGSFFFAAIPLILGVAAVTWFGLWVCGHDFNRQIVKENRASEAVGEKALPKAPVKITLRNDPRQCVQAEEAHFDGDDLWIYLRRTCGSSSQYTELHWRELAADGTVIASGWTNHDFDEMDTGQRLEYKPYGLVSDARITEVVIRITGRD